MKLTSDLMALVGVALVASSEGANMRGGSFNAANYQAKSAALQAMLTECGQYIGDGGALDLQVGDGTGSCPDNGSCSNFYTIGNLFEAIDAFNDGKSLDAQFPSPVQGSRCLTLAGFLGQTYYESGRYETCKEYVSPCLDPSKCSGGKSSDYSPDRQGEWQPKVVPGTGQPGPSNGCTDYWGRIETDSANCWFGRGAIQITWLPNYNRYVPEYINDPDQICKVGKAGWSGSVAFWQDHKHKFNGDCVSATSIPNPANCGPDCVQARCDEQSKIEVVLRLSTAPPTPSPPPAGDSTYTVPADVANQGCWGIANTICPGQGNDWANIICTPSTTNGCPDIQGGTVITYNCDGCN